VWSFKVDGACDEEEGWDVSKSVNVSASKWKSRERESATMFAFPGICSECNVALLSNNIFARNLASSSCLGLATGLNVE
jgi:hypothetical protein